MSTRPTRLARLGREATSLVTREFAAGRPERIPDDQASAFIEDIDRTIDLGAFHGAMDDLIERTTRFDAGHDGDAAISVHMTLRLERREAADEGVWRHLAIIARPDYIRHRWDNKSWASTRTRFLRLGTRSDSNAFSRLWWIAELSRDGDDYSLTRRIFGHHPLVNSIFVRSYAFYRPAVEACVDVLEGQPQSVVEQVSRSFYTLLSTRPLEGFDAEGLRELLRQLVP